MKMAPEWSTIFESQRLRLASIKSQFRTNIDETENSYLDIVHPKLTFDRAQTTVRMNPAIKLC